MKTKAKKTQQEDFPYPVVHLNGSSPNKLLEEYMNANNAICNAYAALQRVEFHSRDYYVHPDPMAFEKAWEVRRRHLQAIEDAREYCMSHAEKLLEAIHEKEKQTH
jgi:hypothetical protein